MKRVRYISSLFCLILYLLTFTICVSATATEPSTQQLPDNAINYSCHGIDATYSMLGGDLGIKNMSSAFLYEVKSDTLMYAMNADQMLSPSSLVKVLTALIAVEKGNLEDHVTVREDVLSTIPYDAVSAELQPDEVMRLDDLLYCMMVGSANDAAAVIADYISGSQEMFVQTMNDYARSLGCTATNFTNVHGLHDDAQYTTARDMSRILSAAVKNEKFNTYYSTVHYTVPATNKSAERELASNNSLMNSDDTQIYYDIRVTGGRTGTTADGKKSLVATAESNDMQLICVVMGSESVYDSATSRVSVIGSFKEASALFDAGFEGFKIAQVLFPKQAVCQQTVLNGDSDVVLGAVSAAYAVLPANVSLGDLRYQYLETENLNAPITAGKVMSQVQIWNGNICVAESDLIAMNSVSVVAEQPLQKEEKETNSNFTTILFTVIVVLGSVVITVLLIRYVSVLRYKYRQKQYRKARRRSR